MHDNVKKKKKRHKTHKFIWAEWGKEPCLQGQSCSNLILSCLGSLFCTVSPLQATQNLEEILYSHSRLLQKACHRLSFASFKSQGPCLL